MTARPRASSIISCLALFAANRSTCATFAKSLIMPIRITISLSN
ncbi:hypothetical protein X761_24395 [Mesorhizobium sp. LSHC424B00]|nr:hypothetical protein X761_24395 [Mesorhizobium sp. LSHC424B00]